MAPGGVTQRSLVMRVAVIRVILRVLASPVGRCKWR